MKLIISDNLLYLQKAKKVYDESKENKRRSPHQISDCKGEEKGMSCPIGKVDERGIQETYRQGG